VIADAAAAAESAAEGGNVGIVGYCWGGQIVYVAACRLGDKLTCGSGYYGGGIVPFLGETPAVPLMLHFGTADASIPLSDVEQIGAAHPEVTIHLYEGADHGFNCDMRAVQRRIRGAGAGTHANIFRGKAGVNQVVAVVTAGASAGAKSAGRPRSLRGVRPKKSR
jgi:dienelactone hydrolase